VILIRSSVGLHEPEPPLSRWHEENLYQFPQPLLHAILYETPKTQTGAETEYDDEDDDTSDIEEEAKDFGMKNFGKTVSPYLTPYIYNRLFFDKQFGIQKEGDIL